MSLEGWNGNIGRPAWWARAIGFAIVLGVLLAVLGPFGSYLNPLPLRLIDQVTMTTAGMILAGAVIPPQLAFGLRFGFPRWFSLGIAIVTTAVPIALLSKLVSTQLWPQHVGTYRAQHWYLEAIIMLPAVLTLWVFVDLARVSFKGAKVRMTDPAAAEPVKRLHRGAILCLQVEDNYVRVHSAEGSTLELMPLHAAIARFGTAGGLLVHRSCWVAEGAVEGAEQDLRKWRLRLKNDLVVPVARNKVAAVTDRGWISGRERGFLSDSDPGRAGVGSQSRSSGAANGR